MPEPAWMEGVRWRDELFGMPPTPYEQTATWASCGFICVNDDAAYFAPAFLAGGMMDYAKRDGWECGGDGWRCPKCAKRREEAQV